MTVRDEATQSRSTKAFASASAQVSLGSCFPVVAIGASAGGLEACTRPLEASRVPTGMAFILVQHLDPTHASLLVELLAGRNGLAVLQATDGMLVEPEHLYVIPPSSYLSVEGGALRLLPSLAGQGTRLPFDVLLRTTFR